MVLLARGLAGRSRRDLAFLDTGPDARCAVDLEDPRALIRAAPLDSSIDDGR